VGFFIQDYAICNTIGGTPAGARNMITGNATYRVLLSDPGTNDNAVQGDYISTNAAGIATLGSGSYGVLTDAGTTGNQVIGNYIGTDATGTINLGNFFDGVVLEDASGGNLIGHDTVANCGMYGILIASAGSSLVGISFFNNVDGNEYWE
jgi:trimeric autotransporter adhesin